MLQSLLEPLGREALGRLTLLLNHVIAAEPEATRRLAGQTGGTIGVEWIDWPSLLPRPPATCWRVTPAGLLELADDAASAAPSGGPTLQVSLAHQALLNWGLAGAQGRAPMEVRGDAGLAAEVGWMAEHLRWDIEDDLARVLGDAPAHQLARIGRTFAQGVRALLQRARPTAPGA